LFGSWLGRELNGGTAIGIKFILFPTLTERRRKYEGYWREKTL